MVLAQRVDLVIVVVYLLLMVAIGFAVSYFNKTGSDFFRGGNIMPWWLAGVSLFMSTFSVYTFTGAAGWAFRSPAVAFTLYFTNALGYIVGVFFLAKLWRRSRSTTVFSYMTERYGIATNQVYSWVGVAAAIVQSGVMLLALSKFISVAVGTDLHTTTVVCGVVIAVYCLIGGLWAVVVTDTLQFMVLFPCALVTMFLAVGEIGGVGVLLADISANWRIPDAGVDLTGNAWSYGWEFVWAYMIMMTFAGCSGIAAQRYFSVKKESDARKVAALTAVLLLVAPAVWLLPPVCTRILGLDLSYVSTSLGMKAPEEAAYVVFCLKYLPAGAVGIVLAAMMSATMSSLSANFNAFAAVITDDIIKQLVWKNASEKALLLIGRLMTLALGGLVIVVAVTMAQHPGGVFQLMLSFSGIVILPAGIPIVCGLFYRPAPWWSGILSYLTGLGIGVVTLLLKFEVSVWGVTLLSAPPTFEQQIFVIGTLSALIYFLPGLLIKVKGGFKEQTDRFFAKLATPVADTEVQDSEPTDVSSYRITGWTTVGMGAGVACLALLDLPLQGRVVNLVIGIVMSAFGLFVLWLAAAARRSRLQARQIRPVSGA